MEQSSSSSHKMGERKKAWTLCIIFSFKSMGMGCPLPLAPKLSHSTFLFASVILSTHSLFYIETSLLPSLPPSLIPSIRPPAPKGLAGRCACLSNI